MAQAAREGCAALKAGGFHSRGRTETQEGASCAGIKYGERRTGLEQSDAAYGPSTQQCPLHALFVAEPRQIVAIADGQPMRAVEVGQSARGVQRGFVVECAVESGVAG